MRWHEWTDRGFFDEEGRLIEIRSVGRDLTEQHEANEQLARSEERYRRLFNSLPIAAWENDWSEMMAELRRRGLDRGDALTNALRERPELFYELGHSIKIVGVNPAALEMAGVTTINEFRTWLTKAWLPESARRYGLALPALISGESRSLTDEFTLIRDNGEPLDVLFRVARSERWGEEWMMFPVAVDITDRKRIQREATRHRDELVRADKMISLGILVSGMAHEINNPNHSIGLNVPLVRDAWREAAAWLDPLAETQRDLRIGRMPWSEARGEVAAMIDDIEHASERIRNIVTELRAFALDHEPEEQRSVAVNDVVHSALRLLGKHIAHATRRFWIDLGEDVPPIAGNARRLEQVVVNLVINACQALESAEQAISMQTGVEGRRAFIRVRDEGRGIAADDLAQIRMPFFTTKRAEGGTGLGLAVSDRIAEEHGGELTFESEPGRGTTATLWLPLART
jgi:C4-dicarboxylate-specific signal transduction histidine kinase